MYSCLCNIKVCVLWICYWGLELEVWIVYRIGEIVNASHCGELE